MGMSWYITTFGQQHHSQLGIMMLACVIKDAALGSKIMVCFK